MLKDVKSKVEESAIQELFGLIFYEDPEQIEKAVQHYKKEPAAELMGYYVQEDLIGIVGYTINEENVLGLHHIAVFPAEQGMGYGRGMILEILHLKNPKKIIAETDEETVEFFRSIGFTIESVGEKYPGVEWFQCTYITDID